MRLAAQSGSLPNLRCDQEGRGPARLDVPYRDGPRRAFDLFPADPGAPVFAFIYGGYWLRNDRSMFSFVADGLRTHGVGVAVIGYPLTPKARLTEIAEACAAPSPPWRGRAGRPGWWSAAVHLSALMLDRPDVAAAVPRSTTRLSGRSDLIERRSFLGIAAATAMGGLNMILRIHEDTVNDDPELAAMMLSIHRDASIYMMANLDEVAEQTVQILGAGRAAVAQALDAGNVECIWALDETVIAQSRTYAEQMLELRRIRSLPDFDVFLNSSFSAALAA